MSKLTNWLKKRFSDEEPSAVQTPRRTPPMLRAMQAGSKPAAAGRDGESGTGTNTSIRKKYVREDTGTHETLKILDDSLVDSGDEGGIDPYNTGGFDRSKNWAKHFRK